MKDFIRQFFVFVSVILTITINALANILPINGLNTGQISDSFKVYFVPAGYVFSIWGLIYIGLIAFAIFQALPANAKSPSQRATGWWIVLSGVANSLWIVLWHYQQFVLTVPVMLVILGSLIIIYLKFDINRTKVSLAEKWAVHIPFSVYLGWISVATVANFTVMLEFIQWNRFGLDPLVWMGILLVIVTILSLLVIFTRSDVAFTGVILWALAGIAVKHSTISFIVWACWICFAIILVSLLATLIKDGNNRRKAN